MATESLTSVEIYQKTKSNVQPLYFSENSVGHPRLVGTNEPEITMLREGKTIETLKHVLHLISSQGIFFKLKKN